MDTTRPRTRAQVPSQSESQSQIRRRSNAEMGRRMPPGTKAEAASMPLYQQEAETDLERLDGQRGCHYLPMDVFLDAPTCRAHFRVSAVRARLARFGGFGRR